MISDYDIHKLTDYLKAKKQFCFVYEAKLVPFISKRLQFLRSVCNAQYGDQISVTLKIFIRRVSHCKKWKFPYEI